MSDKLMVVVKQLREKNERLEEEVKRLRSLVREDLVSDKGEEE